MARMKQGKYGMTRPRTDIVLGTVIVCNGRFDNIEGEIINERNDHMQYLTVQVPSEYKGRVYILNLAHSQCKDIKWRRT
jgi:hypothetical protein